MLSGRLSTSRPCHRGLDYIQWLNDATSVWWETETKRWPHTHTHARTKTHERAHTHSQSQTFAFNVNWMICSLWTLNRVQLSSTNNYTIANFQNRISTSSLTSIFRCGRGGHPTKRKGKKTISNPNWGIERCRLVDSDRIEWSPSDTNYTDQSLLTSFQVCHL